MVDQPVLLASTKTQPQAQTSKSRTTQEAPGFKLETLRPGDATSYPKRGQTVRLHYVCKVRQQPYLMAA